MIFHDQVEAFTNKDLKECINAWNLNKLHGEHIRYSKMNHGAFVDNVATILGISKAQTQLQHLLEHQIRHIQIYTSMTYIQTKDLDLLLL